MCFTHHNNNFWINFILHISITTSIVIVCDIVLCDMQRQKSGMWQAVNCMHVFVVARLNLD